MWLNISKKALVSAKLKNCGFSATKSPLVKYQRTMTQRTLRGTNRKQKRTSGFRARMRSHTGQNVIKARRARGRRRLSV